MILVVIEESESSRQLESFVFSIISLITENQTLWSFMALKLLSGVGRGPGT
jgi:hypothetical protein